MSGAADKLQFYDKRMTGDAWWTDWYLYVSKRVRRNAEYSKIGPWIITTLNAITEEMTTTTIESPVKWDCTHIYRPILTATFCHARKTVWLRRMLCYHSKATKADDKVLSNSASGVDSGNAMAPFDPGAGKKCFPSSFCWAVDSYEENPHIWARPQSQSCENKICLWE